MAENGQEQAQEKPKDQIIITLISREPWLVQIDGNIENLNLALNMLGEATREIETQWRIGRGIQAQNAIKAQGEENSRVQSILDRTMPGKRH